MSEVNELSIEQLKRFFPSIYDDFIVECEDKAEEGIELLESQWPDIKDMVIEQYGENDECAIDQAFNDWTDSLCKEGSISEYTYNYTTREDIE